MAFAYVEPRSPRPWLHIADIVADDAARRGFTRLGLIGTRWLVGSDVYPGRLTARGLQVFRPCDADRDAVILGSTELLLIITDSNSPLPTLDSMRLLARFALHRAFSPRPTDA